MIMISNDKAFLLMSQASICQQTSDALTPNPQNHDEFMLGFDSRKFLTFLVDYLSSMHPGSPQTCLTQDTFLCRLLVCTLAMRVRAACVRRVGPAECA